MFIGGVQRFSLIDYPDKISSIFFTQGCNFRCPYCHNPGLIPKVSQHIIDPDQVFSFLEERKGKLDAVVITGGEPTIQGDLIEFLRRIKDMGYLVKLDTNGSNPEVIKKVIELEIVDYLAMDIKAPLAKYQEITYSKINPNKIKQSVESIINSGLKSEFRTTVVKSQLIKSDIIKIGKLIKGAELYILQKFVSSRTLNPEFQKKKTYSFEELRILENSLKNYVGKCLIR